MIHMKVKDNIVLTLKWVRFIHSSSWSFQCECEIQNNNQSDVPLLPVFQIDYHLKLHSYIFLLIIMLLSYVLVMENYRIACSPRVQ